MSTEFTISDSNGIEIDYQPDEIPTQAEISDYDELITAIESVEDAEDLSWIIGDHIKAGNNKLPDQILIFNLGSATDCPNLGTEHCQVGNDCYALKAEQQYGNPLDYRRRQQIIWDSFPGQFIAEAIGHVIDRKRNDVDFLRLNEAGDFRDQHDVQKAEQIAQYLRSEHDVLTYTYSASDFLDWSGVDELTVNASNDGFDEADQRFEVYEDEGEVPDDAFRCFDDCSECLACMTDAGSDEIAQVLH